jgi:hypothetical protein
MALVDIVVSAMRVGSRYSAQWMSGKRDTCDSRSCRRDEIRYSITESHFSPAIAILLQGVVHARADFKLQLQRNSLGSAS